MPKVVIRLQPGLLVPVGTAVVGCILGILAREPVVHELLDHPLARKVHEGEVVGRGSERLLGGILRLSRAGSRPGAGLGSRGSRRSRRLRLPSATDEEQGEDSCKQNAEMGLLHHGSPTFGLPAVIATIKSLPAKRDMQTLLRDVY